MKLELEDIEGKKYNEKIPKYPSAEIANKCEATYNMIVSDEGGKVENAYEAISEQKQIVVKWLNEEWFENDLGPDRLAPPSQTKILKKYAEYIHGVDLEEKGKKKVEDEEKQD